ncbi:MAG TPA: SPOR domain-containing protein [Steroidobacteraceae bacterium]|nr:SPOR domain-containing protein [Steroidobacteraceae bacterium]
MARASARDYKTISRRPLDVGRYRELGIGVVAGLVMAIGAYGYWQSRHAVAHEKVESAPHPDPHRAARVDPDDPATAGSGQKYDFYEMLPNFEVVVPERDKEVKRDLPAAARIDRPGVYVLQVGSYRNESDAARVKQKLAVLGIGSNVQRVAVDTDVWHRVRIGPITKLDELNKTRRQLQGADIDALVIRVGD